MAPETSESKSVVSEPLKSQIRKELEGNCWSNET